MVKKTKRTRGIKLVVNNDDMGGLSEMTKEIMRIRDDGLDLAKQVDKIFRGKSSAVCLYACAFLVATFYDAEYIPEDPSGSESVLRMFNHIVKTECGELRVSREME